MNAIFRLLLLISVAGTLFAQSNSPNEIKPAPDNKRGVITGKVVADDGQPLIGVGVRVSKFAGDKSVNRSATADEEGNFKATDLPAGNYRIDAYVNGYVNVVRDSYKQRYRIGESATITLAKGGVITGKAYDNAGQPLVGATVNALRVRDEAGRSATGGFVRDALSDDRGAYRIYGLEAGSYVVYTSGGYGMYYNDGIKESPTYHPAATRDTAQEISVQLGAVVTGIDIRHRGERGVAISGFFSGAFEDKGESQSSLNVVLKHVPTGTFATQIGFNLRNQGKNAFALYGIADGEYEIFAQRNIYNRGSGDSASASTPRKITVKGSDVTGIELKLLASASLAGRVGLGQDEKGEKPTVMKDCQITRRGVIDEVAVTLQRDESDSTILGFPETALDEKSEFAFQDLQAGRYRLAAQLPSDHWYLKAITLAPPQSIKSTTARTPTAKPLDVGRQGINLKSGEKLTGVMLTIAEGAAELRGRVTGKDLPARLRVHLVPAEKDDDVLRYAEVITKGDGSYSFINLAPGKYWLFARTVPDDESDEKPAKPVAWDTNERAKLRQSAEAAKNEIILTTCQRVKDHALVFSSTVGK